MATIYVSTTGNDTTGSGSSANPYRTIQKGINEAVAGDTVYVREGEYKEHLSFPNSGTSSNRITLTGEMDGVTHKVFIDPGEIITGWSLASGFTNSVYRKAIGFDPKELTSDYMRVGRISSPRMDSGDGFTRLDRNPTEMVDYSGNDIYFWDGLDALFGYKSDGYTYLRFRNNDNPSTKLIKAANDTAAVTISNKSYITVQNLYFRGARKGVLITGSSAGNNIVDNCYLINGGERIRIEFGAHNNTISNNVITMNYIAGSYYLGSGECSSYDCIIRRYVYSTFKNIFSTSNTSDDAGARIWYAGNNNILEDNYIHGGLIGITATTRSPNSRSTGFVIRNNEIHNMSSVGITCGEGIHSEVYGNYVWFCNINIRLHELNTSSDLGRKHYIYNNRLWNQNGWQFYVHSSATSTPSSFPEHFIYHNSITGPTRFMVAMIAVGTTGGMPKTYVMNNIVSTANPNDTRIINMLNGGNFGAMSYNWLGSSPSTSIDSAFSGRNNILKQGFNMWDFYTEDPDWFNYTVDTSVTTGGQNLANPYAANNNQVLPGMADAYANGSIPMGVYLQEGTPPSYDYQLALSQSNTYPFNYYGRDSVGTPITRTVNLTQTNDPATIDSTILIAYLISELAFNDIKIRAANADAGVTWLFSSDGASWVEELFLESVPAQGATPIFVKVRVANDGSITENKQTAKVQVLRRKN